MTGRRKGRPPRTDNARAIHITLSASAEARLLAYGARVGCRTLSEVLERLSELPTVKRTEKT